MSDKKGYVRFDAVVHVGRSEPILYQFTFLGASRTIAPRVLANVTPGFPKEAGYAILVGDMTVQNFVWRQLKSTIRRLAQNIIDGGFPVEEEGRKAGGGSGYKVHVTATYVVPFGHNGAV